MEKEKNPILKKWWFILIVAVVIIGVLGACGNDESQDLMQQEAELQETADGEEEIAVQEETDEASSEEVSWDDLKENIVGNSDKDYLEITKGKPTDVRNDVTGKWKKSTIAENVKIEEYLLSYKDLYMEQGDTHFIINFNYNTTTRINYMGGLIDVAIMEYVDKEEHDGRVLGSGMLLAQYIIYPDGDIEKAE